MKVELIKDEQQEQELFTLDELPFGLFTNILDPDRVYLKTPCLDGHSHIVVRLMGTGPYSEHRETVFCWPNQPCFKPLPKEHGVMLRND